MRGQLRPGGAGRAAIGVRDSKDPDGPVLAIPETRWSVFLHGLTTGALGR
ncbi:MAG TPA: DUF397 domain-containing protein [Pseudonocardiaceae bacterium]|nr:DUF397 domain-containing protein [Pseudonocardiaceae bacterium]